MPNSKMTRYIFCFLTCIHVLTVSAQSYTSTYTVKKSEAKSANCAPPTTTTYMELNNVRAMVHTAGNLWQIPNQNYSQYEIPKNSGINALFTAALWLGGTDVNNQLKLAALRYRNGQDYWTGPLSKVYAETTYDNSHASRRRRCPRRPPSGARPWRRCPARWRWTRRCRR